MKKVVVLILVLIAAIQLYMLSSSSLMYETNQIEQEDVTKNEIIPLIDDEFNEKLKLFYPNDKLVGFKYTLTEDIESISLKIGKNEYSRSYKIKAGYGEIYIHFKNDDTFSVTIKEIQVEDDNTVRTSSVKTESSLAGYCPIEKDLTMTSYSEFNYPQDIVFNEEITLINHTRGYVEPNSEHSQIEEVNLDIKISFNK